MRRAGKLSAALGRAALVAVALGGLLSTRCDASEYPLPPSFCDDWCRVLRRAECDQEPENCVRTCEQSLGPAACGPHRSALLDCYERAPPDAFRCSDLSFEGEARPSEVTCQPERDALIGCAYPDVLTCLDVCRSFEAAYAAVGDDDAGAPEECPGENVPCDSICWAVTGRIQSLARRGRDVPVVGDFEHLTTELMRCSVERANGCRRAYDPPAGVDPGDAGALPRGNWRTVVSLCVERLGLD